MTSIGTPLSRILNDCHMAPGKSVLMSWFPEDFPKENTFRTGSKANKILWGKYPWLIILEYYAHQVCHISFHSPHIFTIVAQINLVVDNLFKCLKGDIVKFTKKATEFIGWLHGKTIILAHLHQLQKEAGLAQLSVVCAVLTWWTLHYLAYQWLLELKTQLTLLIAQDKNQCPQRRLLSQGIPKRRQCQGRWLGLLQMSCFSGIWLHSNVSPPP